MRQTPFVIYSHFIHSSFFGFYLIPACFLRLPSPAWTHKYLPQSSRVVTSIKNGLFRFESLIPFLFSSSLLERKTLTFVFTAILTLGDVVNILKVAMSWDEILNWEKLNTSLAFDGKLRYKYLEWITRFHTLRCGLVNHGSSGDTYQRPIAWEYHLLNDNQSDSSFCSKW